MSGVGFVRLALVSALAAAVWSSGVVSVENRIITAARWVADHSGATRASEMWHASGRPAVDHAATAGYQFVRQSAMSVFDYLNISTPTNSAAEKLRKAAERRNAKPQGAQGNKNAPQNDDGATKRD